MNSMKGEKRERGGRNDTKKGKTITTQFASGEEERASSKCSPFPTVSTPFFAERQHSRSRSLALSTPGGLRKGEEGQHQPTKREREKKRPFFFFLLLSSLFRLLASSTKIMGANLALWVPSFALGHILGLIFLLYALEKINGSMTRMGKQIAMLFSRGRTKDAPSPASTTSAGDGAAAGAGGAGKGAALAKERAAAIKQTSLYADDGDNASSGAKGGAEGLDVDGIPAATTPRRALLPRWNRACKCEVSGVFSLSFLMEKRKKEALN